MSFFTAVKITDGTNTQTFMSTTTSSKFGADMNILAILGTAPTTAGFIDIKGADGNVFVRQATAANLNATVVGTGTFAVQAAATIADGVDITQGAKADARSTATDTTAVSIMSVLKEISFMEQNPASRAVTNAGTFAVQATLAAETTKVIGTIRITGNVGGVMDTTLGSTKPANALQIAGNDGTNLQALTTDTAGNLLTRFAAPTTAKWTLATISFSASGDNTIVAGVGGQTIRVMRIFFVNSDASTSTNITIKDSTPTNFSGAFLLGSGAPFSGTPSGEPLFVTATGKGFQINSSAAVQISGTVWYTIS